MIVLSGTIDEVFGRLETMYAAKETKRTVMTKADVKTLIRQKSSSFDVVVLDPFERKMSVESMARKDEGLSSYPSWEAAARLLAHPNFGMDCTDVPPLDAANEGREQLVLYMCEFQGERPQWPGVRFGDRTFLGRIVVTKQLLLKCDDECASVSVSLSDADFVALTDR